MTAKRFGVIGGDKRQKYLIESLYQDGHELFVSGFDDLSENEHIRKKSLKDISDECDYVVLPVPVSSDFKTINAPYSLTPIIMDDEFKNLFQENVIFCGISSRLGMKDNMKVFDYAAQESFAIKNAVPTVEGAVEIAMHESDIIIHRSKCLVIGFGRLGKVLAKTLKDLGANVTVSARKYSDFAWIKSSGYTCMNTHDINGTYDFIFNTVPYMVLDRDTLKRCETKPLIIDLASSPGGVDYGAADEFFIKTIKALAIPGKVSPKTAGEIIKYTIYELIEENGL